MDMDTDRRVDILTDYINLCRDTVLPLQTVHCYPNNKPSVTSNIKLVLNHKKRAFREGDKETLRHVQHELKR